MYNLQCNVFLEQSNVRVIRKFQHLLFVFKGAPDRSFPCTVLFNIYI